MALDMELEAVLRAPALDMADYPAKIITLANSKKMIVRQAKREEVPILLEAVHPTIYIEQDYYDIVGVRLYGELLGWYRHRVRNNYCLIGQVDGYVVGIVNGRMVDKDIGMSYHTIAIDRGLKIGTHLFAAKMEHHIEYLDQKEVWITAESPIGFRRWMIEYGLIKQANVQHELGGATSYKLTREMYFDSKPRLVVGERPVPKDLLQYALDNVFVADEKTIREKICGLSESEQ